MITIRRIETAYPAPIDGEDYCPDVDSDDHGVVWSSDDPDEAIADAATYLRSMGVREASSSHWRPGMWYISEASHNYRTGEHTIDSFFIQGSEEDQRALAIALAVCIV